MMTENTEHGEGAVESKKMMHRDRSRSVERSRSPQKETRRERSVSRSRSPPRQSRRSPSHSPSRDRRRYRSRSRSPVRSRYRSPPRYSGGRGGGSYGYTKRYDPKRDNPDPSRVLGVFGLSRSTDEERLREIYSKYGPLEKVVLVRDGHLRESRGFGFIYFETINSASEAREATNGADLDGRCVRVDYSISDRGHNPTPGEYRGVDSRRDYRRSPPRHSRRYSRSRSRDRYRR